MKTLLQGVHKTPKIRQKAQTIHLLHPSFVFVLAWRHSPVFVSVLWLDYGFFSVSSPPLSRNRIPLVHWRNRLLTNLTSHDQSVASNPNPAEPTGTIGTNEDYQSSQAFNRRFADACVVGMCSDLTQLISLLRRSICHPTN
jgi:hypothetical protein